MVVAASSAGRNGRFVETIGTYNPVSQPKHIEVNAERALHWLRNGAQPTETIAILLNKTGVLEQFFAERPAARKEFAFLDRRTAATAAAPAPVAEAPSAKKAAPVATAPEPEPEPEAPVEEPEAAEEVPVVEDEVPVEETQVVADEPAAETTEE